MVSGTWRYLEVPREVKNRTFSVFEIGSIEG